MKNDISVKIVDLDSLFKQEQTIEPQTTGGAMSTEPIPINEPTEEPVEEAVNINIDKIMLEWSYRCNKGYPVWGNDADMKILKSILSEMNIKLPILESAFTPAELNRDKYFDGFIDKLTKGEPFTLEKDKSKVVLDKQLLKTFQQLQAIKNLNDRQNAIRDIFGKNPIIITADGDKLRLGDISKDTFTAKTTGTGLVGTETPDFKEGLVVFFYSCPEALLNVVYNYLTGSDESTPDFGNRIDKIDSKYYGTKSAGLVKSGIEILASGTELDNKTKKLFLNALSAAYTIQREFGTGYLIDRGDLFTRIRKTAKTITSIPEDKWCPGDVYLYKQANIKAIDDIIKQSEKNNAIVNIEAKNGDVLQVGLNSLFETNDPFVIAVSLKEEEALSGRAKEFLSVKNIKGLELGTTTSDFTKEEFALIAGRSPITNVVIQATNKAYDASRTKYSTAVGRFGYKNQFASSKSKQPEPLVEARNKIIKTAVYRMLINYFNNFEQLKGINSVMKKYKDPFLALTAFGVSLSGFNPTFYKVVANSSGDYGHITIFKGRDSLKATSDSVVTIDTLAKAGVYLEFLTKMGDKTYKTKLDVREAKSGASISIAIIVDEFKAE